MNVRRVLRWWPWIISGGVHLSVLAVMSTMVVVSVRSRPARPEIIPDARLGETGIAGPLYRTGAPAARASDTLVKDQLQNRIGDSLAPNARPAGGEIDVIGSGQGDFALPGLSGGLFAGAAGSRGGSGGPSPVVDPRAMVAAAPKATFFKAGGNAYSIVYVVDISPSILSDKKDPLFRELRRSLDELAPMQKFHVILFAGGEPIEEPSRQLNWASERNKRRYYEFLEHVDFATARFSDPRGAIERALELNPDLVYLLTDGDFKQRKTDPKVITDAIIVAGNARKVKINTIAFCSEQGAFNLRRIAESTGGIYRFVSEGELQW